MFIIFSRPSLKIILFFKYVSYITIARLGRQFTSDYLNIASNMLKIASVVQGSEKIKNSWEKMYTAKSKVTKVSGKIS